MQLSMDVSKASLRQLKTFRKYARKHRKNQFYGAQLQLFNKMIEGKQTQYHIATAKTFTERMLNFLRTKTNGTRKK